MSCFHSGLQSLREETVDDWEFSIQRQITEAQDICSWERHTRLMESHSKVNGPYGNRTHNLGIISTLLTSLKDILPPCWKELSAGQVGELEWITEERVNSQFGVISILPSLSLFSHFSVLLKLALSRPFLRAKGGKESTSLSFFP